MRVVWRRVDGSVVKTLWVKGEVGGDDEGGHGSSGDEGSEG